MRGIRASVRSVTLVSDEASTLILYKHCRTQAEWNLGVVLQYFAQWSRRDTGITDELLVAYNAAFTALVNL